MSLAAQGAYLKILCYMWADSKDQCSLEDNDELISRALGISQEIWIDLKAEIQHEGDAILKAENGFLISLRLREEALKQKKFRKLQSNKGKSSAQQRFNRGLTRVQPVHQPEGNSSSSSSSSSSKENEKKNLTTLAESDDKSSSPPQSKRPLSDEDYFDLCRKEVPKNLEKHRLIWGKAYPGIDLDRESAKALSWLMSHPRERKSLFAKFLNGWMSRAQESCRSPCKPSGLESALRRTARWIPPEDREGGKPFD